MSLPVIPIQVLLSIFLLFALSRVYLRLRSGELKLGEFLFWSGLFTFALVGVIEPNFTNYVADIVGIGRGADVAIYASIVILFYLIFRTNVLLENVRHEVTQLVRIVALIEAKQPKTTRKRSSRKRN